MARILENNGIDNTNIDGASFNNFCAGQRSGVIKGVLNECAITSPSSSVVNINTGALIISGVRVILDTATNFNFSTFPSTATRYSLVAEIVVDDNSAITTRLFVQLASVALTKNSLYATSTGAGTYQIELAKFTLSTDGVSDLIRTVDIITGGAGSGDSVHWEVGDITTETLDVDIPAEVDIDYNEDTNKYDFSFGIPQGPTGPQGDIGPTGPTGPSIISANFDGDDIKFTKDDETDVILEDAKLTLKGDTGLTGPQGETGPGVAAGGTTGQVLKKKSADDYDTEWADETGGIPQPTTEDVDKVLSVNNEGDYYLGDPMQRIADKVTSISKDVTDVEYPSAKAVRDFSVNISGIWDGTTSAAFESGTGTESDPYIITNGAQLSRIRNTVGLSGKHYKIVNDIFLNTNSCKYKTWDVTPPDNEWVPIGVSIAEFTNSVIDGGNFTIYGLYINKPTSQAYSGFMGNVSGVGSAIKNINFANCYINGYDCVGGIIANNVATQILNSSFSGIVKGNKATGSVGGIVGYQGILGPTFDIIMPAIVNCSSDAEISSLDIAGGIVGTSIFQYHTTNRSKVLNSYFAGNITATIVGGIVGYNAEDMEVQYSYSVDDYAIVGTNLGVVSSCSLFSIEDKILDTPVSIGGVYYAKLTYALNSWAELNKTADIFYLPWVAKGTDYKSSVPVRVNLTEYFDKYNLKKSATDVVVEIADWVADTTYADYGYKADLTLTGMLATYEPSVVFGLTEVESGNYASVCLAGENTITIYAKEIPSVSITIPLIKGVEL